MGRTSVPHVGHCFKSCCWLPLLLGLFCRWRTVCGPSTPAADAFDASTPPLAVASTKPSMSDVPRMRLPDERPGVQQRVNSQPGVLTFTSNFSDCGEGHMTYCSWATVVPVPKQTTPPLMLDTDVRITKIEINVTGMALGSCDYPLSLQRTVAQCRSTSHD